MWTANRVVAGGRGLSERFDHYELVTHPASEAGVPLDERAFGPGPLVTERALAWIREHEQHAPGILLQQPRLLAGRNIVHRVRAKARRRQQFRIAGQDL